MSKKILIVDDNKIERDVIAQMLSEEFLIIEAENGKEALSILISNPYSISAVIVDAVMPVMDGFELVKKIRSTGFLTHIPAIVITASTDENALMNAVECGANNFLVKPCNPKLLLALVKNNVHLRETASIANVIQKDSLTGLLNREAFMKESSRRIRRKNPGYYIMSSFDINHFKVINDQYGMKMGEKVLKHLGTVFDEGFSSIDGISCRISDDRFAMLYPAQYQNFELMDDIHRKASNFQELPFPLSFRVGRYLLTDLSVSAGVMYDRAVMAGETIRDKYEDDVAYYDDVIRDFMLYEQQIVDAMGKALIDGEFEVWFQPQHNHSTGALIGSEALLRWKKDGVIVPPNDFIPIFEKNGYIYNVDKFVWRQVCEQLRRWIDQGKEPLPVSVNISRYDLIQKDFIEFICRLVEEFELPADLLRLEVTESAFADSPHKITAIVTKLIDYGFTVEIDDFGSGYSSLNTLKDVPAQVLKLDMRFFESGNSQRGGNIIESVVRMAKWLGMAVIAEGIEKQEQADYLKSIGCEYIQGFLYAKPMPIDEFEQHCAEFVKEAELLSHETIEGLNQNSFWDPSSMDTLIFNSYVGAACILEYAHGKIEMLRATKHYIEMLGNDEMSMESAVALDWGSYLDPESFARFEAAIKASEEAKDTVYGEYDFIDIPGCPKRTTIRGGVRVIATSGDRKLIYCINENITAQREAEEKEKEATKRNQRIAEQLEAILNNIDVGIVASTLRNDIPGIMFANDKYYEILGYTEEQFAAEVSDPYETFVPEEVQWVKEKFKAVAKCRGKGMIEAYMLSRDGTRRFVRCAFSTCNFESLNETVYLLIFRDITEEHEAELREKRFAGEVSLILQNVDCGIAAAAYNSDNSYDFIFANDQFYTVTGYTREQFKTEVKNIIELVHPDDQEEFQSFNKKCTETQIADSLNFRCIKKDGSVIFLNRKITFANMTGYGRVGIIVQTDISEVIESRTEAEKSQQEVEKLATQLKVIVENTADAITAIALESGDLDLVYANSKHFEQLGVTKGEYETEHDGKTKFVIEEDRAKVAEVLKSADAVGKQASIEYRIERVNGDLRWMRSNISVVNYPDIDGPVQLAVTSDVTEKVEASQKALRLVDEMQTLMADIPGGFARVLIRPDDTYEVSYCNEGFCKLIGMNVESIMNRYSNRPIEGVHPSDVDIVRQSIAEAKRTREVQTARYRVHNENKGYVWVTGSIRFTKNEKGNAFLNLYFIDEKSYEKKAEHKGS